MLIYVAAPSPTNDSYTTDQNLKAKAFIIFHQQEYRERETIKSLGLDQLYKKILAEKGCPKDQDRHCIALYFATLCAINEFITSLLNFES